ncbi:uncharacterized protein LOC126878857 [Diabrotica virgifera virgifera]|uniref:Regulatory protein zeste n=1 Tax=Diabrotica virgifera virgifera TaxID=50390 RepID=A0A6P7GU76_DIAVI|nr:uncharacterized protein LOC126878857 [Diabrotica virgifera virgifera]
MRVQAVHWEMLLSFCEENPQLITNKFNSSEGRAKAVAMWQTIANRLNSLGYGEKSVEGWRKTLTDWKSKTKAKAATLRRDQGQTGGGSPHLPPLSPLEERILSLMGVTAFMGNETVPELGFGEVEVQHVEISDRETPKSSMVVEHDYSDENQVDENDEPCTSHGHSSQGIGKRGTKRKLEYGSGKGKSKSKGRMHLNVPASSGLLQLSRESVNVLKGIQKNTDRIATSLETLISQNFTCKCNAQTCKNNK